MIFSEDDPPPRPKKLLVPPPLDLLGVEELGAYIGELQGEIARVEQAIGAKRAHKDAAAAFFRTK
ncbi:DUF1192 domain-containing protein [Acidocella sp.]|uniref:DUF1192 domain-containing protein n=1 Tax=Acidocella sp. TaxID=50710 RepID=UPI00262CDC34|nr:DUF1192 domain-containing protein [Acidocella sp.]